MFTVIQLCCACFYNAVLINVANGKDYVEQDKGLFFGVKLYQKTKSFVESFKSGRGYPTLESQIKFLYLSIWIYFKSTVWDSSCSID